MPEPKSPRRDHVFRATEAMQIHPALGQAHLFPYMTVGNFPSTLADDSVRPRPQHRDAEISESVPCRVECDDTSNPQNIFAVSPAWVFASLRNIAAIFRSFAKAAATTTYSRMAGRLLKSRE